MTTLPGQNVLITGGSRGIGPIIAEEFAKKGANIAIAARSKAGLLEVEKKLTKFDIKTCTFPIDLADQTAQHALIASVIDQFGRIDILINNAGVECEGAYLELPWEEIRKTIEINFIAPMALTYEVLPHMLEEKRGHIINISSVAAHCGSPFAATYCGTKAGLSEWTRALRLELEGSGVYFSTIYPGYITEVGMFARFHKKPSKLIGFCTPEQVAKAVVRAYEKKEIEIIVNSAPARLLFALSIWSPRLGDWLKHKLGIIEFQRSKVKDGCN